MSPSSDSLERFEMLQIVDVPALDPINVIFQDTAPRQGRILVECYGSAWACWWGNMGDRTVRQFVASCDASYLAGSLLQGCLPRGGAAGRVTVDDNLRRICEAILAVLQETRPEAPTLQWGAKWTRLVPAAPSVEGAE